MNIFGKRLTVFLAVIALLCAFILPAAAVLHDPDASQVVTEPETQAPTDPAPQPNSNLTIVTSDNPRFEKLDDIISDIMSGIKEPKGEVTIIKDRRQAIYHALSLAKKDDIVLIVGKGNQDYEEIEGVKYPFDEREVVRDYFRNASR